MSFTQDIRSIPLTDEQAKPISGMTAEEMEDHFMERIRDGGVTRKLMFVVLTQDVRELVKKLENSDNEQAEAFLSLMEKLGEEQEWFESHLKLVTTAHARVTYALSHVFEEPEDEQ